MSTITVAGRSGNEVHLNEDAVAGLRAALAGTVARPGEAGYDEARTIWNAMVDKRPGLIARCTSSNDVKQAVDLARTHGLLVAVRSGGHNIAGNAVCDDGFMIDLSQMKEITVDREKQVAAVGPGATLGDVDAATQPFGLATPTGINSTTGIAGLTLGGGFGWLSRTHGFTVDNLVGAQVVTAAGEVVEATDHPDLFWAIRGGGGNFGIVTRFDFRLHEVGPEVLCGLIVYPAAEAVEVLRRLRAHAATLSDETTIWGVLRKAPPLPFLSEQVHGTDILALAVCHIGELEAGERAVEPLRQFGTPVGEHIGVQPFTAWQQAFDPLLTPGARNYWKSHNFAELSDPVIERLVGFAAQAPSPHCEIFIAQLGGATSRIPADATAYPHRDAAFLANVHSRWETAVEDERCIGWAREFYRQLAEHATGGVYVNFMPADESDRVRAAYGPNWDRLVAAKRRWDPENLFSLNQNISP